MEFSLLDHLTPCLPCLTRLRGHSGISLLQSPHASSSDLFDEQRDRLLFASSEQDNPDLLSLHSNIDGRYNKKRGEDASSSLSRWQLLVSWWKSGSRRNTRYNGEDDDAEELLPEEISPPQPRQPERTNSMQSPAPLPTMEQLEQEEQELAQLEEQAAIRKQERRTRRLQQKAAMEQRAYEEEPHRLDFEEFGPLQEAPPRLSTRSSSSRSRGTRSETSSEAASSISGGQRRMRRKRSSSSRRNELIESELEGSETMSQSTAPTSIEGEVVSMERK